MLKIKDKKIRIISILVLMLTLIIPTTYSFFFFNYESSIISKFKLANDVSNAYVRAEILTYWIDTTSCVDTEDLSTCDMSGKSSWKIKDGVLNDDWILLDDGFYYYKNSVLVNEINKNNIKESEIVLINPNLSLSELSDIHLTGLEVIPQYEIIYEFIESDMVESAWNITYSSGAPSIIN